MARPALLAPLLLAAAAACTQPTRREPIPSSAAPPERTSERAPRADADALDRETAALLERLLVEAPYAGAPGLLPPDAADERPRVALVAWELGAGPFVVAGRDVPPSALRYALAVSLERRFAAGGPLAGPLLVELPEGAEPPPLDAPPPEELRAAARALGAEYLLHGRLERLEEERREEWLERGRRRITTLRGRLELRYRLLELDEGRAVCEERFERSFDLGSLPADELASAEWLLAWEAARLVREDLAACLSGADEE